MNGEPRTGDLVFFPPIGTFWDFFIRWVSPRYSHVGFFIDENTVIDANLWTVEKRPMRKNPGVIIKRIKRISKDQGYLLAQYALEQSGEPYSVTGAIWSSVVYKLGLCVPTDNADTNWHCSKLVIKAIRNTLDFDPFPNRGAMTIFPDTLFDWDGLETVVIY